jgi:hypothetical protein
LRINKKGGCCAVKSLSYIDLRHGGPQKLPGINCLRLVIQCRVTLQTSMIPLMSTIQSLLRRRCSVKCLTARVCVPGCLPVLLRVRRPRACAWLWSAAPAVELRTCGRVAWALVRECVMTRERAASWRGPRPRRRAQDPPCDVTWPSSRRRRPAAAAQLRPVASASSCP